MLDHNLIESWQYEADRHCKRCAVERFDRSLDDGTATDTEGSLVGAVYPWDEIADDGEGRPYSCGTCGDIIGSPQGFIRR
jgi:hypothetical protein